MSNTTKTTSTASPLYYVEDTQGNQSDLYSFTVNKKLRRNRPVVGSSSGNAGGGTYNNPTIGNARHDENENITGGKSGDNNGHEVETQVIYYPTYGWKVYRALDPQRAERIALCMEKACKNNHIGYDQSNRTSLYNAVKDHGFDVSLVTTNVECDCSSLVAVCCNYAGISVSKDMTTSTENSDLTNAVIKGTNTKGIIKKYSSIKKSNENKLVRGDILLKTGHTAVYLGGGHTKHWVISGTKYGSESTYEFPINSFKTKSFAYSLRKIRDYWVSQGCETKNGYAAIDGCYLIACTSTFGKPGDKILWKMSDGTTIPTIMTDEKSQKKVAWDSDPANKYGHAGGKRMIEWCGSPTTSKNPYQQLGITGHVTDVYNCGSKINVNNLK